MKKSKTGLLRGKFLRFLRVYGPAIIFASGVVIVGKAPLSFRHLPRRGEMGKAPLNLPQGETWEKGKVVEWIKNPFILRTSPLNQVEIREQRSG
ncbi:MAG: hypothetical protein A2W90_01665 [Bacteroidetes bacterium GWF2_42_66]|nr:MAG: hypothetical protein A2W92_11970 [Bacteroidetes bacterium GWA2_42_15]OFY01073.1 MAG: hypothetical protein A2W89_15150 [Bacteroidetes bacterium GWE2_42_39]OFY41916.1 MAG: hypothetical protein A2W90_01665 [Bacteroidetes bacterium GWF2_42_66]HBL77900.1 hypothetical protein [Prolixibacteraceae bacterium]HCU63381.1 hypothetical protein [Prolixibacteraceae bacterium]